MSSSIDVLVVGAGPVSLMMASELRRHGANCRIIDKLPAPLPYCKALGIQPRTLEIWEDIGVATEMINAGIWFQGVQIFVNGKETKQLTMDLSDIPYGFMSLPQYEVERILTQHLSGFGGVVEREVELQSFQQSEAGITATLSKSSTEVETVQCKYLIGCDGAHSPVRHGLNLSFEGGKYPQEFILGDVLVEWSLPHDFSYRFLSNQTNESLICVPLPEKNRFRLSMVASDQPETESAGGTEHGFLSDRPGPSLEELQSAVDRLAPAGTKLHDLRWSPRYHISHRIVSQYSMGNVFIAGDAAHIHPPIGGQGMNTGLQDAYNLAWKLALAVQGVAAPGLLDSYNAERLPVGEEVVGRTHKRMVMPPYIENDARRALMQDSQLLVNYRETAWVGQDLEISETLRQGLQPGDRAPDAWNLRREGLGFPVRVFDLLRGTVHKLLIYADASFTDDDFLQLEAITQALRKRYGKYLEIYTIIGANFEPVPLDQLPMVKDAEGNFQRAYDAVAWSTYLVRPDGYIGYWAQPLRRERLEQYLSRIFSL